MAQNSGMNGTMAGGAAFMGFMVGSAAGLALGMLFAPKTGKESRDMLRQRAIENLNKVQHKINQGQEAVRSKVDNTLESTKAALTKSEAAIDEAEDQMQSTASHRRNQRPE